VAKVLVLKNLAAQSHLSIRTESIVPELTINLDLNASSGYSEVNWRHSGNLHCAIIAKIDTALFSTANRASRLRERWRDTFAMRHAIPAFRC
jgi:hypothetical protein